MRILSTSLFCGLVLHAASPTIAQSDYYSDYYDDPCVHTSENDNWALDVWIVDATLTDDLPVMANRRYTHLDSWFAVQVSSVDFGDRQYALQGIEDILIEARATSFFGRISGTWDPYRQVTDYPGPLHVSILDPSTRWEWETNGVISFGLSHVAGEDSFTYAPSADQDELATLQSYLESHGRSLLQLRVVYQELNGNAHQLAEHDINMAGFSDIVGEGETVVTNNANICEFPAQ